MEVDDFQQEGHLTNYTQKDIFDYVLKLNVLTQERNYSISLNPNREDNIRLMQEFYVGQEIREKILLSLSVDDFCYCLKNDNPNYSHEILYVFHKQVTLQRKYSSKGKEHIHLYIKINMIEKQPNDYFYAVSFHEEKHILNPLWGNRDDLLSI